MDEEGLPESALDLTLADRYRVLSRLGRGGMGEVYEGHDIELDRRVALKVAPREHIHDAIWVERFMRQARALARIDHPGVVRVFDRGLHENSLPFVVMEYLIGQDLAQALRVRGKLALEQVLELGEQIASALVATHDAGVIHRDLKPGNVMLLADAGQTTPRAKLVDFGVSKLSAHSDLTGSRELLGTMGYLAPELLEGPSEASASSDIYGLGVILFELISGRRPFREHAQAELLHSIRADPPPSLRSLNELVPRELDDLIARMLAKLPSQRPSASDVLGELSNLTRADVRPWSTVTTRWPSAGDVLASRFELVRMIGEGRSGVVYEARDRQHAHAVALKILRHHGADDLYRLKREYRTLQEIAHPNIVQIDGLFLDETVAFLTMELLTGPPFMVLATSTPALDALLVQVVRGLATLHARGLTHRDVKPSNIRVAGDGRVVLLDFGLVVDDSSHTVVAGTPPYMAPEVLEGKITPAADMYAFGVILHELLTGELPSENPSAARSSLPALLSELCAKLLSVNPDERPTADQVLRLLEAQSALDLTASRAGNAPRPFVGRERELAILLGAAARVASDGRMQVALVHGPSGIGKTTLVEQLARSLPAPSLALIGRCREAEAIPYPALDGAIDALSEHLTRLPPLVLRYLLPREVAALPLLFPVLRRVDAFADSTPLQSLPIDPLEVRTRAFRAFKELLRRLADQHPLVLVIDDVQWIDPDSVALLSYCFTEPDPPRALLVFALRDDTTAHPEFGALTAALRVQPLELAVEPFTDTASHQLARSLWPGVEPDRELLERVTAQSGGHPFLLTMLLQHASGPAAQLGQATLDGALLAHVNALPDEARRMLELVAVCQRPLPRALFLALFGAEGPALLHALRRERLLQRQESRTVTLLDVYHARVRDAVVAALPPARKLAHHRALAAALAQAEDYAEAHVEHLEASGQVDEAAEAAVRAANAADEILAFERAASLYATARKLLREPEAQIELLEREAAALRNAGRLRRAGRQLEEAAGLANGDARLLLEAGRLLLLAGDLDDGFLALAPLLQLHAVELPGDQAEVVAASERQHKALSARGLLPANAEPTPAQRERCELLLSIAQALSHCDMRGLPFAFEAVHAALDLGDRRTLQRALAVFVISTASHMHTELIEPAIVLCAQLTPGLGPYAQAMLNAAEAEAAHFTGQFLAAETSFERAERMLVESCIGATRELSTVRNGGTFMQYAHKGDFATRVVRTVEWLRDAEAREDVFHASMLRVTHAIVWIAHDDPQRARSELQRAETEWSTADGFFEVVAMLYLDITDRYLGREDAHLHPVQGRKHVLESPVVTNSFLAGYVELHRAWGSLRALARGERGSGEQAMVERAIENMQSLGTGIWEAVSLAFQANLLFLQRQVPAAVSALERSEHAFRRANMLCLAATARRRRGELAGGEFGSELVLVAERELRTLGVVQPARWCSAYFSPFPAEQALDVTIFTE